jgi:hypothetical protein
MAEDERRVDPARLAQVVQANVLRAALEGYETAAADGLCAEGAWEAAVEAMRRLRPDDLLAGLDAAAGVPQPD